MWSDAAHIPPPDSSRAPSVPEKRGTKRRVSSAESDKKVQKTSTETLSHDVKKTPTARALRAKRRADLKESMPLERKRKEPEVDEHRVKRVATHAQSLDEFIAQYKEDSALLTAPENMPNVERSLAAIVKEGLDAHELSKRSDLEELARVMTDFSNKTCYSWYNPLHIFKRTLQPTSLDALSFQIRHCITQARQQRQARNQEFESALVSHEFDKLKNLLREGVDIPASRLNFPIIKYAVIQNRPDCIEIFCKAGFDVNQCDFTTALDEAIRYGNIQAVRALIKAGADVNRENRDGLTPLSQAIRSLQFETVKILAKYSDLTKNDYLTEAIRSRNPRTVEAIASFYDLNTFLASTGDLPIFHENARQTPEILKALVKSGADINKANASGYTLMHLAVTNFQVDSLKTLLELNADPNIVDTNGQTPLHYVWKRTIPYQEQIVDLLVKFGASINKKDNQGHTALHLACIQSDSKGVHQLLALKADVTIADNTSKTALHYAAKTSILSNIEIIKALAQGFDINQPDIEGKSALHYAVEYGNTFIIRALALLHPDFQKTDLLGNTALYYARDAYMIRTLVSFGLPVSITNNAGLTAADIAWQNRKLEQLFELISLSSDDDIKNFINKNRADLVQDDNFRQLFHFLLTQNRVQHDPKIDKLIEMLFIERCPESFVPPERSLASEVMGDRPFLFQQSSLGPYGYDVRIGDEIRTLTKTEVYEMYLRRGSVYFEVLEAIDHFKDFYLLKLKRAEIAAHPEKVLDSLSMLFKTEIKPELYIRFTDEIGIDAGGLGRQFVHDLVGEIAKRLKFTECDNKLFRPLAPSEFSESDKKIYQQLGDLLMFCFHTYGRYPIGMVFDTGVFDVLTQIPADKDLAAIDFDAQMQLLERLYRYNENDLQTIERLRNYLALANINDVYDLLASEDETIARLDKHTLHEHVPELKTALKKYVTEAYLLPNLSPLFEIAKGMRQSLFQEIVSYEKMQSMKPLEISQRLQGTVSKEEIVAKLQFHAEATDEIKEWLKDWINRADVDTVKAFLFALSGSTAIGERVKIFIQKGDSIKFHTCFNTIDLDFENIKTAADLDERLQIALIAVKTDSRFDIA